MSIGAIANIVNTNTAGTDATRPAPPPDNTGQAGSLSPADGPQEATVTTLSAEALALQATDDQAARDAADAAGASALTSAVYLDWAPGAPNADGAVQDALNALTEASRENLQAAETAALTTLQDQAALEQKAVDEVRGKEDQQGDALAVFAMNAEIRLAYGALPTPVTGASVLRDHGQMDVIA